MCDVTTAPAPADADATDAADATGGVSTEQRLLRDLLGERALRLGLTAHDRLWGWLGPLLVTVLAAVLRLWDLGRPATLVFDETYYVKQAYTLLEVGYDAAWPDEPNARFEAGDRNIFLDRADYVVHPPVGKWMIALGMKLGGAENPWAWRLATAVVGILGVWIVARVGRRVFSSTVAGVVAGGIFAIDGAAIVHARTGLLDSFVMFWALVGFALVVADRFDSRRRLAARAAALIDSGQGLGRWGPGLGVRWYRIAAAIAFGLCIGTKWSGAYFLAVMCVIVVLWDASARRTIGVTGWANGALWKDAVPAAVTMVPLAGLTYLASWTGWFVNRSSYKRTWAEDNPGEGIGWLPGALRSFVEYHRQMWDFHTGLTSPHTYQSHPLGWLLQLRPTSFYYRSVERGAALPDGLGTCEYEKCSMAVTSLGNPLVWWLGTAALVLAVVWVTWRKDWRGVAVLSGLLAGWAPWLLYAHRTIFTFYTIAFAPWVYLALGYAVTLALEHSDGSAGRRRVVRRVLAVVGVLIVVVSVFFYPIWTAKIVPFPFWQWHMWLRSWI
ncbi:dolichyl-phosphate-mannose--protein mannosyltransferase [Sanguibacter sp. A247]|uniref:dolichyl-phosphate-mannose--protein mannosyltransferase n=1 Tax=unclassified Sanguibacter TaxID=2645534 RepID=UPI003FD6C0A6